MWRQGQSDYRLEAHEDGSVMRLLILVAASVSAAVASGCLSTTVDSSEPQIAIERCIAEIKKWEPGFRLDRVDRAYALLGEHQVEMLFSMGEIGWFGTRSEAFSAEFS
jgi:hypothetical protein